MLTIVQGLHSEPGIAAVWAGHSAGGGLVNSHRDKT